MDTWSAIEIYLREQSVPQLVELDKNIQLNDYQATKDRVFLNQIPEEEISVALFQVVSAYIRVLILEKCGLVEVEFPDDPMKDNPKLATHEEFRIGSRRSLSEVIEDEGYVNGLTDTYNVLRLRVYSEFSEVDDRTTGQWLGDLSDEELIDLDWEIISDKTDGGAIPDHLLTRIARSIDTRNETDRKCLCEECFSSKVERISDNIACEIVNRFGEVFETYERRDDLTETPVFTVVKAPSSIEGYSESFAGVEAACLNRFWRKNCRPLSQIQNTQISSIHERLGVVLLGMSGKSSVLKGLLDKMNDLQDLRNHVEGKWRLDTPEHENMVLVKINEDSVVPGKVGFAKHLDGRWCRVDVDGDFRNVLSEGVVEGWLDIPD